MNLQSAVVIESVIECVNTICKVCILSGYFTLFTSSVENSSLEDETFDDHYRSARIMAFISYIYISWLAKLNRFHHGVLIMTHPHPADAHHFVPWISRPAMVTKPPWLGCRMVTYEKKKNVEKRVSNDLLLFIYSYDFIRIYKIL